MPQRQKRKLNQNIESSSKRPKKSCQTNSLNSCLPDVGRRISQRFKSKISVPNSECMKSVKKKVRKARNNVGQDQEAISRNFTVNGISKKKVKKKLENDLRDAESKKGLQTRDFLQTALEKAIECCDNFGAIKILESSANDDFRCQKVLDAALIKACSQGMLPAVLALLERGAHLNKKNDELGTPLTAAVEHGYLDLVRVLLQKGADVNLTSTNNDTALMTAVKKGFSMLLVMDLINAGADVNAANKFGKTTAMIAVEKYDLKTLILLLSHGAKMDMSDGNGKTLFDLASEKNLQEILKLFVESKSDVALLLNKVIENNRIDILRHLINSGICLNSKEYALAMKNADSQNSDKETDGPDLSQEAGVNIMPPLCLAAANGKLEIVRMLIGAGFSVDVMDSSNGMTAVMFAANGGHDEVLKVLHKHGANINAVGELGYTALTYAVKAGKLRCAQILLKLGAVINSKLDFCIAANQNQIKYLRLLSHQVSISDLDPEVLLAAVRASNYKAVEFLTNKGMDVNAAGQSVLCQSKDKKMNNLLIKKGAVVNGFGALLSENDVDDFDTDVVGMIKLLIKRGHHVNEKDFLSLINATHSNNPHVVKILLKAGADPDGMTPTGETALMIAAQHNYTDIMTLLLKNGASADKQAQDGYSALMFASMNSCQGAVKVLLNHGADVHLKNNKGDTALLLTTDADIVKLLVGTGAEVNVKNNAGLTPLQFSKKTKRLTLQKTLESLGAKDDVCLDEKGDKTSLEADDFQSCVENQNFAVESTVLEDV